jgi:glutaredoxin 3
MKIGQEHRVTERSTLFMKKIEIYTTNYCPFCVKVKSLFNKKKIKFYEIDVSNNAALRKQMSAMANGARSVPQVFADDIHIGDCDKIHKLDQEKKLDKLLGLE